jgi:hypothetical protein
LLITGIRLFNADKALDCKAELRSVKATYQEERWSTIPGNSSLINQHASKEANSIESRTKVLAKEDIVFSSHSIEAINNRFDAE